MGLLQRLLGRRDTPDSVPDPAPDDDTATTSDGTASVEDAARADAATTGPESQRDTGADTDDVSASAEADSAPRERASSGALADAAPTDDENASAQPDSGATDAADGDDLDAEATGPDIDRETDEPAAVRPRLKRVTIDDDNTVKTSDEDSADAGDEPVTSHAEAAPAVDADAEDSIKDSVAAPVETPADSPASLVAVSGPATLEEEDSAAASSADATTANATASTAEEGAIAGAGFVPERPKRQLLTLEKPEAPTDIPAQRVSAGPGVPQGDQGSRSGHGRDLSLDTEGSPRPALRSAGVAVPKMQQIARRDDVRLWAFPVKANEALGWWLEIRQVHERTGWLPVLIGHPADWRDGGEEIIHEGDDELGRSEQIDVAQLLEQKGSEAGEPARGVPILPRRGDSDFATPRADGLLGLVRADYGWQIPGLLPWKGSTNWELYGAEHCAVLRHWTHKYDVELMAMTFDVMELYVANPPEPNEAIAVAEEIYAYCPDLLDSGVPTLDDLAEHMAQSRAWYFRWT
ncbi:DUF4253 domain-containing protein [Natronoglycomyces albus]|uniref:DUF4253 domain-containing protein n=1 Tax=Natronoglycomyces albus TaxID=2811108 RepID=A0A895XUU1_9ACTN|nr:DUF4253 domain-containing protein [Natronoglycomyces albus]QSB05418.1 DUF4253 domain-containing protein [Natronoglycomyces albus]